MTSQFPNLTGFQDLWDMFIQASTPYVKTCFLNTELLCLNTEMTWRLYLASLCSLSTSPEATFWTLSFVSVLINSLHLIRKQK